MTGTALIKTLGQGQDFMADVKAAWVNLYRVMADVLKAAAKQ